MNFNGRLVTIDFDDHSISRRFIVQFDGEFYHFEHSYALTNTETDAVFRRVKSIMIRYARLLMIRYCYATAQDDERVRTEFDFVFLSILNLYFQETFIRIFSSKLNIPLKYLSSGRIEFIQLLNSETRIVMFCNYYRWTNRTLKNLPCLILLC